jgi:molybdopterin molybdotransferase
MKQPMLSVAEARARVIAPAQTRAVRVETIPLEHGLGRTLAGDLTARRTQPPSAVSAMDGYALRAADVIAPGARLRLVGESAAGHGFSGRVGPGETARIFTGAPVPEGADTILIQEDAAVADGVVTAQVAVPINKHFRAAGADFSAGEVLLKAGRRLGAAELALAAAMNHALLPVARKPLVAILATGDELVRPGEECGPDQIVASNAYAVAAQVEQAGGLTLDLGIARDNHAALEKAIRKARRAEADVLVTLGGASVGDHDLVKAALAAEGMELGFWRIAMRPGKPLIHGRIGDMSILGLPGNPVSSIVCGLIYLQPLVRALCGDPRAGAPALEKAVLGRALPANDVREDYLRADLESGDGLPVATPFESQDSSLLSVMAAAKCLLIRPPHAPKAGKGEVCSILRL